SLVCSCLAVSPHCNGIGALGGRFPPLGHRSVATGLGTLANRNTGLLGCRGLVAQCDGPLTGSFGIIPYGIASENTCSCLGARYRLVTNGNTADSICPGTHRDAAQIVTRILLLCVCSNGNGVRLSRITATFGTIANRNTPVAHGICAVTHSRAGIPSGHCTRTGSQCVNAGSAIIVVVVLVCTVIVDTVVVQRRYLVDVVFVDDIVAFVDRAVI